MRVAKMGLDFVAQGWQEPPEELKASPEATGSSEGARECHQGHAIPRRGDECALY